jgi:hypothetical protein
VDNQLPNASTQVVLHPTQQRCPQPTLRMFIRKNNTASESYQLASYDVFQFVFQEIDVNLEQQTVLAMWEFLQDSMIACPAIFGSGGEDSSGGTTNILSPSAARVNPRPSTTGNLSGYDHDRPDGLSTKSRKSMDGGHNGDLYSIEKEIISEENKLYVSHFQLHPVKINVSFVMSQDVSMLNRSNQNPKSLVEIRSKNALLTSFTSFMKQIGELLLDLSSNITRAPIFINSTNYDHLLTSEVQLSRILKSFYFHSIVTQVLFIILIGL